MASIERLSWSRLRLWLVNQHCKRFKCLGVPSTSNECNIVMVCSLHPECLFGFVRRCEELFSMRNVDHGIFSPVDDKNRTMHRFYFAEIVELIERKNSDSRHNAKRACKRALQNQSRDGIM